MPKVIDFGVAKATDQRLTERTMFTGLAVRRHAGVHEPEQAELTAGHRHPQRHLRLGVLLYELLTGTRRSSRKQLQQAAFDEMLRSSARRSHRSRARG